MTEAALWGHHNEDGTLDIELDDAIGRYMDNMLGDDPTTQTFVGWSALPPGESGCGSVPSGKRIAEWVAEYFGDDCGFEELGEHYHNMAKTPEVIAAFDAARALMVSKQTFLVADKHVQTATVQFMWEGYDKLTYEIVKIEDET